VEATNMVISSNYAVLKQVLEYACSAGLAAGDKLPSCRHLADTLQIDRHKIRDALVQAEAMGLVRVYPRAGAFIRAANLAPLIEFFRVPSCEADSPADAPG
jgi:DNA-binding FadR family transcriptional regulator